MGYAVDYRPTRKRARRQVPANKAQRTKDIKNAIRWNLPRLEHDTVSSEYVTEEQVRKLLKLNMIARTADPEGVHVLRQLSSSKEGGYAVIHKPERIAGVYRFRRDDLIASLKAWVGLL
ncbi:hypothetical protein BISA_1935 [Bifidobacterium saguini DSM 23967]|uniref:Uncharacterized protein n=2 Tax=Bifidobacterium saguini TaxID=762210 RepID=A0A087D606_9BIFI|nr:hypothetical protein [Bifidobacterium saguini]KFI90956.1 hypothetical protein BISA_1935 [Bifidobacterium saguini DSM 23967]QTB91448.1 hypothetical protein BSD967_03225 [Bifidobacterium saguini]